MEKKLTLRPATHHFQIKEKYVIVNDIWFVNHNLRTANNALHTFRSFVVRNYSCWYDEKWANKETVTSIGIYIWSHHGWKVRIGTFNMLRLKKTCRVSLHTTVWKFWWGIVALQSAVPNWDFRSKWFKKSSGLPHTPFFESFNGK